MSTVATTKTIKKAMQDGLNKFNFDKKVIATQDFGYHTPVECKLVVPRDKFEINVQQFTRLMPLPCPTYGKIESVTRAFFVPMHQLFKDWENFISNRKTPYSALSDSSALREAHVPYFNVYQLSRMLLSNAWATEVTSSDAYDIKAFDLASGSEAYKYYKVSAVLRHVITWLNGLGYNFPWCVDSANVASGTHEGWTYLHSDYGDEDIESVYNTKLSALPLIAYWKFYLDWCVPSRFIRDGWIRQYTLLDGLYKCDRRLFVDSNDSALNRSNDYQLNSETVYRLVSSLPVSYFADDYFSQAFKSPFGYEDNMSNNININNPGNPVDSFDFSPTFVGSSVNDSPRVDVTGYDYINSFSLHSLGALQDLVNRGKLAGNKIQDYLRVTYGITPSNDAMNVSTYLGSHRFDIQIGDVMSNADTKSGSDGAYLGEYAGRGLGGDTCKFSYEAKEHGYFFITNELYVRPSYIQGLRPEVTALDRFDFFQPEFDNLGVDAIDKKELTFTPINFAASAREDVTQVDSVGVFGFTPRYGKLKTNYDSVLGDFRFGRVNTGLDSWYLSRMYNKANNLQWKNGINYMFPWQYGSTGDNYDRIFQVSNQSIDHFYSVFNLNFTAMRAMKSLTTPFEVVENHGDSVTVETQGLV